MVLRRALIRLRDIMLWFVRIVLGLVLVLLVITIPFMSWELYKRGKEPLIIAWYSAGAFAVLAILISLAGIIGHLTHYHQPHVQRFVVRILWMVPIYAIESWLSLRFKETHVYLQVAREAYESFVIYSFFSFLVAYVGSEKELIKKLRKKPQSLHIFPFNLCFKPWKMGADFLMECKFGTFQYVAVMNICSIAVWIMEEKDLYKEGKFDVVSGYTYITIIKNFSQCWAIYCLVLFYHATKADLVDVRPLGKFICVKVVVFFSFWQAVFIALLVQNGLISGHHDWTEENVATGLQDFLICIEMFLAAVVHHFVFSYKEYEQTKKKRHTFIRSFIHSSIPSDMYSEMTTLKKQSIRSEDVTLDPDASEQLLVVDTSTELSRGLPSVITAQDDPEYADVSDEKHAISSNEFSASG